ncbi:MAG: branched-chain amino acid ABC transporter permease [Dehalococcoidia bacterium]|nr:branched-chain amino acid ABC transporter permease [Dehalococcoidia bacterium]
MHDLAVGARARLALSWTRVRRTAWNQVALPWGRLRRSTWGRLPPWVRPFLWFVLSLGVLVVPAFDDTWMRMFFLVALYATLGMGLNVVVGLAGLLDLGYVAFFATGAYTVGILGSPESPAIDVQLAWWLILPLAIGVGAIVGVLLGLPVLPLRGDYLAIVTLGFGEIIRILLLNMTDKTNGSSGLFNMPRPSVEYLHDLGLTNRHVVDDVRAFYILIVVAAFVVWFVTARLRDSRVGRAWEAIREDEDVAEGMGINTTKYKLMAFSLGASIGALGGAIYAPFIDTIVPSTFSLLVSINVLALVIIGGMGSTQGVVAGALILIGVPELLQFQETKDFLESFGWLRTVLNAPIDLVNRVTHLGIENLPPSEEWGDRLASYRFIVFGALLVLVMVLRPSGLFPSRRRQLEFEAPPEAERPQSEGIT